ncbi:MAG: type IV pilus secretin PilQ [Syntrophobacteraceae bacterium]
MHRQGNILSGTLPLILGVALFLGCSMGGAGKLHAAGAENEAFQKAGQPSATAVSPLESGGTGMATTTPPRIKIAKAARPQATQQRGAAPTQPGAFSEEPATPVAAKKQYTGKTVSLDLMDADLRNVLRLLSDLTTTNIVIEPDVAGKVTLKVENVPWDQVLDMILAMNDLGSERVGNVIRIARQSKLKSEWLAQAESIRAKQELSETTKDLGELSTVYFSVNFGKPADIAARMLEAKSERGKVAVDERTSLIIYTDYPARVASARQLLQRLDRATPQVLIEARIITLRSSISRNLGVNLAFSAIKNGASLGNNGFAINPPISGIPQFDLFFSQLIGKTMVNVDLEVQALETANEARIVAAPRVLTLDNVKATVTQGTQVPYLKVGDTAANITAIEFKDATLELQVTPHITPDRKVRMTINAKQDTVSAVVVNDQPGIDTRKVNTELLVDDGNVIVIGGVIDNSSTHNKRATPGLHQIPILGRLFKTESSEEIRNELLIFISPKIVEASKPFDKS